MQSRVLRPLIRAAAVALCLAWPAAAAAEDQEVAPQGTLAVEPGKPINYQGFVTDALGTPLQGRHNFTVYLYDAAAAGSIQFGREDHLAVNVVNGHFRLEIGAGTLGPPNVALNTEVFDVDLWLEVWVDGSPLPRQPLRAVPWAYGLIPGAKVWGDPTDSYALRVIHTGTGDTDRGIYAYGYQYGLYAQEVGPGSDAIYSGSYVNAQGYRSRNDSYVWFPGVDWKPVTSNSTVAAPASTRGAVYLRSLASAGGSFEFYLSLTLPGVLLGQNVTVEQITVYYKSSSSANAYITETALYKLTDADTEVEVLRDLTDRVSTTATSYSLAPASNNVLSGTSGPLLLVLKCNFENDRDSVKIGMVRIRLGHTETP
jgi:hypothetical protein